MMKKNTISRADYLNKLSVGCVPCKEEVLKIERKIGTRKLSELKIEEIKQIVKFIFQTQ